MINKGKLTLELEMGKNYQRFYCEITIRLSWFCFNSTTPCHLPFERNQFVFPKSQLPSFLPLAETQLFKFFFHLTAFGYILTHTALNRPLVSLGGL